ncbi:general odorant-binding protein 70 isoform X1 [Diabrotica virgifera virgifera]|uniref:General odorant-binding protein 70 isoform X1 n=1 Tax=Diabrotica virgifera virgifera TaxID=50390 RepID=A0A6P7F717_DIAVI|nr:general odorant-binding protein 70 isoform X1 [Diabrotica virgifera virgifera]
MFGGLTILSLVCFSAALAAGLNETKPPNKCEIPASAPKKVEEVINQCQDEIKLAILSEALETINVNENAHSRAKRAAFTDDEKRIAGCLLQCVYRKMKAVNEIGFPTESGLISLYTSGIPHKEYIRATVEAVTLCLRDAKKKYLVNRKSLEEDGKTCDVAYEVFDCVSDEIGKYCGQTP